MPHTGPVLSSRGVMFSVPGSHCILVPWPCRVRRMPATGACVLACPALKTVVGRLAAKASFLCIAQLGCPDRAPSLRAAP
eukprot:10853966-Heterocapsa_arctica.AAC.1